MLKKCVMMAALLLVVGPASARADWLFTPNIGVGFGGDSSSNDKLTYGASIGYMGAGIFGFEADLAYTPQFFEDNTGHFSFTDSDNVTTAMANLIVGVPVGGQHGHGVRPYFAGGMGVMKTHVQDTAQLFNVSDNDLGVDIGGGVMGFVSEHVGLRGDVRYYRDLQNPTNNGGFTLATGNFNFWRGTMGLTFRW
jgi:opacity protein-like surface antigen